MIQMHPVHYYCLLCELILWPVSIITTCFLATLDFSSSYFLACALCSLNRFSIDRLVWPIYSLPHTHYTSYFIEYIPDIFFSSFLSFDPPIRFLIFFSLHWLIQIYSSRSVLVSIYPLLLDSMQTWPNYDHHHRHQLNF